MITFSAVQDFLYFVQAWQVASKLRALLDCMEVPRYRKNVTELHNLQWLASNLGNDNYHHHLYPEAKRLYTLLFDDSRYRALKAEMWRCDWC